MKLKGRKVNIYRETYVPNGSGYTTKVIEPVVLNVWAYFRQLSGKRIFAAAAYRDDEEVLFTINYRAGLTTACYVEYGGVKYSVTRIDTFEGYKQDITAVLQAAIGLLKMSVYGSGAGFS